MGERLSLIVPVFNEAMNAKLLLQNLSTSGVLQHVDEIVLVDDGSLDETWQICTSLAEIDSRVRAIRHKENLGLGAALRTGVLNSLSPTVSWVPADGQIDLCDFAQILEGYQRSEIWLLLRYGRVEHGRNTVSQIAHSFLWILFGVNLRNQCGVFILPRNVFIASLPLTSRAISCLELSIRLQKQFSAVNFAAVHCLPRISGQSKTFSVRSIFRSIRELIGLVLIEPRLLRRHTQTVSISEIRPAD